MSRLTWIVIWGAVCGAALPAVAAPPPLIADLSSNHINITTGFTGARLLLFGATEDAGDVVVVVRGPQRREVVRRKERVAGIWVNRRSVTFEDVPGFYFVAGTRPLSEITSEETLRRLRIGTPRLPLRATAGAGQAHAGDYRDALVRLKRRDELFSSSGAPIKFLGGRLFRVEIKFPVSVPTGAYTVEVHLFHNGNRVSVDRKSLSVRKAGIEATIYNFAHQYSAIYGILAIVVALIAGWLAGVIFRRV